MVPAPTYVVVDLREEWAGANPCFWASSDALPGFYAAADTREELVTLVTEAVHEMRGPHASWLGGWTLDPPGSATPATSA